MEKYLDRKKIAQNLRFYLEVNKKVRESNPDERMVSVHASDLEDALRLIWEPVGTTYEYGFTLCKHCGADVTDDDNYCPACGRLLWTLGKEE